MNTPTSELKRRAREILTGNYLIPVAGTFISTSITTALLLPFYITNMESASAIQYLIFLLAEFIIILLQIILSCGLIHMHMNMTMGRSYEIGDLFYGFRRHPQKIAGAYILLMLRMILPILPGAVFLVLSESSFSDSTPFAGLALIVFLAGMVWAVKISLQYALIFYLLMENPESTVKSIFLSSKSLMEGNKLRMLYLNLSFLGLILLGMLSFGIGMNWVSPYMLQTGVLFYRELADGTNTESFDYENN